MEEDSSELFDFISYDDLSANDSLKQAQALHKIIYNAGNGKDLIYLYDTISKVCALFKFAYIVCIINIHYLFFFFANVELLLLFNIN